MRNTRTRIAMSVSASLAVVAAAAGTAGARIPADELRDSPGSLVQPGVVVVPDAVDRAVRAKTRTLEAKFQTADAVARAIARRNR